MTFEGVGYNMEWVRTKTEAQFVKEFENIHYQNYSKTDRVKLLKEAYWLMVGDKREPAQ